MPIGMLEIYHLLFVCFFLFIHFAAGFLVRDISCVGWHRAMKFGRMIDLGGYHVISPLVNFGPGVSTFKVKSEKSIMHWMIVSKVRQTYWAAANHVWQNDHQWLGDRLLRSHCISQLISVLSYLFRLVTEMNIGIKMIMSIITALKRHRTKRVFKVTLI